MEEALSAGELRLYSANLRGTNIECRQALEMLAVRVLQLTTIAGRLELCRPEGMSAFAERMLTYYGISH